MVDLPSFGDMEDAADEAVERTRRRGRGLIPWLSDPPECEECGSLLYASYAFDWREAMRVASWECRNEGCGAGDVYRDPEYGSAFVDGE